MVEIPSAASPTRLSRTVVPSGHQHALVMGILNVTPDSFSDGGMFRVLDAALTRARALVDEGAGIIDVGGESTRPGAPPVCLQKELDRVMPVIEAIHNELPVCISIDTSKPEVMRAAVGAGAGMINDVRALRVDGALTAAAELDVSVCLMHMQGEPSNMQLSPRYVDVVREVRDFLLERVATCVAHGLSRSRLFIDPGFGFGKTLEHNLHLLAQLHSFVDTGIPVLVGLSRKSMVGAILERPVEDRLVGSIAAAVLARSKGAAVLRVHDVAPTVEALRFVDAVNAWRTR